MNKLTRLSYIDVLKIAATFAIVLLHVSALYVRMDAQLLHPSGALPYMINNLTRTALPLFMMISGVLLMRDGYRFKLRDKFTFILKYYVVWSAIFVLANQFIRLASGGDLLSPAGMVVEWIRGPYHFWYLQMLLGFYIIMPILSRIKDLQTLTYATVLLFAILYLYNPFAQYLPACVQTVATQLILSTPSTMLFFFLLGASIHRLPHQRNLAVGAGIAVLVGLGMRFYQLFSTPSYQAVSACEPFDTYSELLLAAGLCYLVSYACRHYQDGPRLQHLSQATLRIYIISALFIFAYQYLIQPYWDALVPWHSLSILLWASIVFLLSWLTAALLTRKDRVLRARRDKHRS